jgi:hypothetical protein
MSIGAQRVKYIPVLLTDTPRELMHMIASILTYNPKGFPIMDLYSQNEVDPGHACLAHG